MNKPLQPQSHRDPEIERPVGRNENLTGKIIGCAIEVHRRLGPGLLESVYESALAIELETHGIPYRRQVEIPINYRGKIIGVHKLDFIVDTAVVLELKSVERFDPVFEAQILTYMRIANLKLGLLINFNSRLLHEGIKRLFSETYFSVPPCLSG